MAVKLKTIAEVTLTDANVRKRLSETPQMVYGAYVQGLSSNTGNQYFGDNTVDANNGFPVSAVDVVEIDGPPASKGIEDFDLSEIYLISDTAGVKFRIVAWVRK